MNEKMSICPICRGGGILVHRGTRDNSAVDVYKCCECETRYLSVIDKENDYENGFMYETNRLADLSIEERLRRFEEDDMRRCDMIKDLCKGKNVLDFGCGFGGFLHCISEHVNSCSGVELGKQERNYLHSKGFRCYKTIDESEQKFDVITLFHTFEHLSNPKIWLEKFHEYLTDSGYLIIEVPNGNDVLLSLYESEKFADFTYWSAHLFLYTIKSLTMLVEEVGLFDIVSAGQVQRYPLSNHLMWLAKGSPGGQNKWNALNSKELNRAYTQKLMELEMCDTLFFVLKAKR